MNPVTLSILLMSLAIGTTVTLSSQHWLLAWIGLEINTLAIIPLLTKNFYPRAVEAATKYFLTQAAASALILFSCLFNAWKTGEWSLSYTVDSTAIVLSIALAMKLGLAPMHFWMPDVLQGIPMSTGLVLSTWQKIAPMILLIQISQHINPFVSISVGFTSILIGGWGGISQTQMRKILAFSSIGHLGWTIIILKFSPQLATFNFALYIILTMAMFVSLMALSSTSLAQVSTSWAKAPALTASMVLVLLSLAGLPPLTGFSPKLMISLELVKQNAIFLMLLISFASLLSLYFYLRLTYVVTLTLSPNTSYSLVIWRTLNETHFSSPLNIMAIFAFPLTPTLILLM
uniref:NADH dehydrogenase subunit 2 n=1 Tax=Ptychadena cooperi TaxID=356243 RepID=UPI00286C0558|nr:NADH dehydrogenase subunit 2 [Ptychadena cooperi]WKT09482.1 NADH dehydrogenase subunit 2 [Ptychadena cooperi]WKT09495.1 NADH dehydrogenase subunit 2 [Ptychadena cooperi]WKT09508.1 NADH dehydrogenase subunit 2 [Ptychadena cooperi]WKT09521.1 NADH dehydrogenase subunit 2 [Ptychadena cooperi]WKT09534.1 NADH dehydrogenase subunit 2 [Ptychadena cooperi]